MNLSILDLVPIRSGTDGKAALQHMVDQAKYAESLGYSRYWLAEHHNMPNILSSATIVLIQHVLQETKTIRVGSGGIMLPNHSPYIIAEQFGTLDSFYPNRLDLGLGRAPGTDRMTAMALRRADENTAFSFPSDVAQLQRYFAKEDEQGPVVAYPAVNKEDMPFYILGSSTDSAHLAAKLGLPYVFATHFAPQQVESALKIYRDEFKPSRRLKKPHVMLCLNVVLADDDAQAEYLQSSQLQQFLAIIRNDRQPLQPPVDSMTGLWNTQERMVVESMSSGSICGGSDSAMRQLEEWSYWLKPDEIITSTYIYDIEAQFKSIRLFKEVVDRYKSKLNK